MTARLSRRPSRRAPVARLVSLLAALALILACTADARDSVTIESLSAPSSTPSRATAAGPSNAAIGALRVAAAAGLRDLLDDASEEVQRATGRPVLAVAPGDQADLELAVTSPSGSDPILRRWSVVAAAGRLDLSAATLAAVEQAAAAGRVYSAPAHAELVRASLPSSIQITPVTPEALAVRLVAEAGSFGLMPADRVTVRVRTLALDGIDPATGAGDVSAYPLVTRGHVVSRGSGGTAQAAALALTQALARPEPPLVRLAFTGDIIPARCVYDQIRRTGDWGAPFSAVAGRLQSAAIAVGSLDAALSNRGTPIGCRETFQLLSSPEAAGGMAAAGLDVVTVATNHVKDCGAAPPCGDATFLDTLAALRGAGMQTAGGGATLAEARRPALIAAGGVRFAFLGYDDVAPHIHAGESTPGVAPLDEATLRADIRAAREVADVVIVLPQWGEEYTPAPTARQRRLAAVAVEAGAALVAGNHPHVVQAATPISDGYVAYALGNFLFDQDWSTESMESVVLEATFRGPRLVAVHFLPIRIEGRLRPVFLDGREAQAVLDRMMRAAAGLGD